MNALVIEPTEFTPRVVLDHASNKYEIEGESRPENADKFYSQIIDWLSRSVSEGPWRDAQEKNQENYIKFDFKLEYFNSASAKQIIKVLMVLENVMTSGREVKVIWHYDESDELIEESGREFENYVEVPFEFNPY